MMDILTAIDVIESISGVTDESTPAGEAWEVILSAIYARPTPTTQAMQERQKSAEIITSLILAASELYLWTDSSKVHGSEDFSRLLDHARAWAERLGGNSND